MQEARRSGRALGLSPERSYADYAVMAQTEAARADGIEAVAIVTPNHLHAAVATAFLKAGIHVICDKPVTTTSRDAKKLLALVNKTGLIFAVTHNYSGYPMVRHARQMVSEGRLGEIRLVQVESPQDWLTEPLEKTGQKQAAWRTDPARSGAGGAIGDIGTHAHQLAAYVSGLELDELCAELSRFVKGRALDDNAQVMLRYRNGARGLLWASQVAPGNQNNLRLRVYGSKGGLDWHQEQPNQLHWSPFAQPTQILDRSTGAANAAAARVSRIPSGHPEGYLEGFATIYAEIAQAIRAARPGGPKADKAAHFPTLEDGLKGVQFIEAVVKSSARGGRWVRLPR